MRKLHFVRICLFLSNSYTHTLNNTVRMVRRSLRNPLRIFIERVALQTLQKYGLCQKKTISVGGSPSQKTFNKICHPLGTRLAKRPRHMGKRRRNSAVRRAICRNRAWQVHSFRGDIRIYMRRNMRYRRAFFENARSRVHCA